MNPICKNSPKGERGGEVSIVGEVSILIPHPLSLVVNVNFYSCLPTIISYALSDGTFSVIEAIAVGQGLLP